MRTATIYRARARSRIHRRTLQWIWYVYKSPIFGNLKGQNFLGKKKWVKTYQASKKFVDIRYAIRAVKELGYKYKHRIRERRWDPVQEIMTDGTTVGVLKDVYCDEPTFPLGRKKQRSTEKEQKQEEQVGVIEW